MQKGRQEEVIPGLCVAESKILVAVDDQRWIYMDENVGPLETDTHHRIRLYVELKPPTHLDDRFRKRPFSTIVLQAA